MSKKFIKDSREINLETSREIEQRIEKPKPKFSTSHAILQNDLVKLLAVSEGRRDKKWIEDYCSLRKHCIDLDIWESFNLKYNLHRGFTAEL
jgi:hypothetical protein